MIFFLLWALLPKTSVGMFKVKICGAFYFVLFLLLILGFVIVVCFFLFFFHVTFGSGFYLLHLLFCYCFLFVCFKWTGMDQLAPRLRLSLRALPTLKVPWPISHLPHGVGAMLSRSAFLYCFSCHFYSLQIDCVLSEMVFYQFRFLQFQWSKANNFVLHTLCVAINTEVPVSNKKYPVVSKDDQFFCGWLERRTLLTINLQHVY